MNNINILAGVLTYSLVAFCISLIIVSSSITFFTYRDWKKTNPKEKFSFSVESIMTTIVLPIIVVSSFGYVNYVDAL